MGSEMCIRDRAKETFGSENVLDIDGARVKFPGLGWGLLRASNTCLLYTSDAADERSSVDLGGRRIIKKKKTIDQ